MYNTIDSLTPVRWVPTPARQPVARRPALAPLRDWLARHWPRPGSPSPRPLHDELVELDAHTLADIGAPDHLLGRAMARREAQRQEREGLALGLASGAWHHW
jgi:hypothetical protein